MDLSTNQEPIQATKVCTKCGRELPVDCFSRRRSSIDGLQAWCKSCQSDAHRGKRGNRQVSPPD